MKGGVYRMLTIGKGIVFHDGLSGKHLTISDYT